MGGPNVPNVFKIRCNVVSDFCVYISTHHAYHDTLLFQIFQLKSLFFKLSSKCYYISHVVIKFAAKFSSLSTDSPPVIILINSSALYEKPQ